jgi:hypothetical protein
MLEAGSQIGVPHRFVRSTEERDQVREGQAQRQQAAMALEVYMHYLPAYQR